MVVGIVSFLVGVVLGAGGVIAFANLVGEASE